MHVCIYIYIYIHLFRYTFYIYIYTHKPVMTIRYRRSSVILLSLRSSEVCVQTPRWRRRSRSCASLGVEFHTNQATGASDGEWSSEKLREIPCKWRCSMGKLSIDGDFYGITWWYPLVMTNIAMEKSTMFYGNIHYFDWAISQFAMLVITRGYLVTNQPWFIFRLMVWLKSS